jgi:hypothetical protein
MPDGCGGTLECDVCPTGQVCGGGGPNLCGTENCTPKSCEDVGAECGAISDGCGSTAFCGTCAPPESCGGGGTPKQCGCTPKTCASAGKNCGQIQDGCGGALECGTCASPETCGGGGIPNVCGCAPANCSSSWCGAVEDGCGNTVLCPAQCAEQDDCDLITHQCVACVVDVCAVTPGKCVVSSPCDGTNHIPLYCPCPAGEICDLTSGDCV